ncbi:MAG: homocysteine S-methyltransferase family protein [Alphaproteobacteria bacterium]
MSFILLDGGMGQELVRRLGQPATPLWSVDVIRDRPDLVTAAHGDFLRAGADVITLSSYSATPSRLAGAGREGEFESLQAAALAAARRARDEVTSKALIAGCLPPLPGSYRPEDRFNARETTAEYERIVAAQADGVDLFLCETLPSVDEARLATRAARRAGKPVWTALTVDEHDGRILRSGETVAQATAAALEEGADAVLINCSPPEAVTIALQIVLERAPVAGAYANGFRTVAPLKAAGTVDALEAREDLSPDGYADLATAWAKAGATIIGGCCEISPAHINAIHRRR